MEREGRVYSEICLATEYVRVLVIMVRREGEGRLCLRKRVDGVEVDEEEEDEDG